MVLNESSHFRAASFFKNFVMPDFSQPFRTICLLCLKCGMFACNSSLDCSIFFSEDFPGRRAGASVALCMDCDKLENWSANNTENNTDNTEEEIAATPIEQPHVFKFECASRGFHEYRKIWVPRLRQKLSIFYEKSNVYDLYAMALARSTQATVTGIDVVGHLPREISRFCKFFYDYGRELSAFLLH